MDLGIAGRTAAVAAGSAGLGLGTARALVAEGVKVVICGRDRARLDAALASLGGGASGIVADVGTAEGAEGFLAGATDILGASPDILVANAGGPPRGTSETIPLDAYRPALEQNLVSAVALCLAAVPPMRERGWGRIVAITSISVRQPIPALVLSNTARAGLTGFLKTLAGEVAADGVTVNSVQPGSHATERLLGLFGDDAAAAAATVPVGVLGDPDDFGAVVAFLCSEQARFVTGAAVNVDGGQYQGLQ